MFVIKNNAAGEEVWRYPVDRVLFQSAEKIVIEAVFNRPDTDLGFTTFKRNDRFIEWFFSDRFYNIFAIYDRDDGHLKGWYCNVCRPHSWSDGNIAGDDLALDVWVDPDGSTQVMDEAEFAALSLTPQETGAARHAVDEILFLGRNLKLPTRQNL